jgi:hypothetical protein
MSQAAGDKVPKNEERLVESTENFRQHLIEEVRGLEIEIEEELENSNKFENIRVFSRLPANHHKHIQLLAAAASLGNNQLEREIKNNLNNREEDRLEDFKNTVGSRDNRFFPEGDASYHQNSDTLVLHHIPKEILDRFSKREKVTRNLNPLLNLMFSEKVSEEDLKDILAH